MLCRLRKRIRNQPHEQEPRCNLHQRREQGRAYHPGKTVKHFHARECLREARVVLERGVDFSTAEAALHGAEALADAEESGAFVRGGDLMAADGDGLVEDAGPEGSGEGIVGEEVGVFGGGGGFGGGRWPLSCGLGWHDGGKRRFADFKRRTSSCVGEMDIEDECLRLVNKCC